MISTSDFKNGTNILVDGEPYQIAWFQNHKPGKGGAVMRVKLRHLKKGGIIERTFKSGEKFKALTITRQKKRFLYKESNNFNFMDMDTYEQITVHPELLGKMVNFLKENLEVEAIYLENELIGIDLPVIIEMTIAEAEHGIKGDSVSNTTKTAKLETGADIHVPLFIKEGDRIKVDTRTGEYVERA
ncbi:elongation factor P [Endomicrobiia bacterium]|uniref:Elongation factor P n=1 Tax=Endomicrobium trichonymphae TaxID=1408204 RepID=EFP_ENDTX|nr:elongation factor P [Candidatus Endomicrobium trichonymphae]B1GZJ0.1 RecName: Full=Elongation factor P; Short=EF-P [Candidatus Endomicrobium trichonymphae]GHT06519.1 elongation factor P [Endomicrobiia bacterium]BAG13672.1 elongation factor P [Candidatus Endomicrobium trichonymphae]GHT09344.1 elongation factor P [Endomicrobiia bacterium]GHT12809.1 elongation factor P [Endomicrobiia bacterium]GHT16397.1 elongation factor P [Endomicrobiia bacterium]